MNIKLKYDCQIFNRDQLIKDLLNDHQLSTPEKLAFFRSHPSVWQSYPVEFATLLQKHFREQLENETGL